MINDVMKGLKKVTKRPCCFDDDDRNDQIDVISIIC